MDTEFYKAEVDRHLEWVCIKDGAMPQRSIAESGSAEAVFLVNGTWLTVMAGDDEEDEGTWFWACGPNSKELFEFTIPWGEAPSILQFEKVNDLMIAMGTNLPYRLPLREGWPSASEQA